MNETDENSVSSITIDWLFEKLAATYMSDWERKIGGTPVKQVKSVWLEKLRSFDIGDVRYAISNLTAKPPNVFEFRDLCRAAPRREHLKLEAPSASPVHKERLQAFRKRLEEVLAANSASDPLAWALKLKERDDAGDPLTPTQRKLYKEVLRKRGGSA